MLMALDDDQGRGELKLSDAVRMATIARWQQFIKQNRASLRR